ncbi:MAG: hypothetical protein J0I14_16065 [Propionibacteriaceae bacterium]|nr:hypothetical protein [Propionibacteriaceae bacterium]
MPTSEAAGAAQVPTSEAAGVANDAAATPLDAVATAFKAAEPGNARADCREHAPTSRVEVLCVCTGNVARSPAAERLLGKALGPFGVRVTSAGTGAPQGAPIAPQMDERLLACGIDARDHQARWLTEAEVQRADLVLGMAREHRSRAVELVPSALRRSFTLLGFAAIARAVPATELAQAAASDHPADRLRALIQLAPRYRPLSGSDEIDDPVDCDVATYARVFAEIESAVAAIAAVVTATADDPVPSQNS